MTDLENRLRDGLARHAADAPDDLGHLRASLRRRLAPEAPAPRATTRWVLPVLVGLAVVAATAGIGALLPRDDDAVTAPTRGGISKDWACADRRTVDLTHTLTGPQVGAEQRLPMRVEPGTPPAEVAIYDVARYAYELDGDHGSLTYADAGGRRTAVTTLGREQDGTWRVRERTLCVGTDGDPSATAPDADVLSPARRPGIRPPTRVQTVGDQSEPVLPTRLVAVDNRTVYDQVGREEPASTYAYFDGRRMSLLGAWGDSGTWGLSSEQRLDADVVQGALPTAATQDPFLRLATDEVNRGAAVPILVHGTDLAAMELHAGDRVIAAQEFHTGAWGPTRLFAALAPAGYQGDRLRLLTVVVTHTDGRRTTYPVR